VLVARAVPAKMGTSRANVWIFKQAGRLGVATVDHLAGVVEIRWVYRLWPRQRHNSQRVRLANRYTSSSARRANQLVTRATHDNPAFVCSVTLGEPSTSTDVNTADNSSRELIADDRLRP
jgi:hypothetical protein